MSLPLSREVCAKVWNDEQYIKTYGEMQFFKGLNQYEKTIGNNWADEFNARSMDNPNYGLEEFHKEVILPALSNAAKKLDRQTA